jgi:hypothetical protein
LFVLGGCEAVLYGTAVSSAVAVNELNSHTLPKLENIDRVEVEYCPAADFHNAAVLNLVEPETINQLVLAMNNNRSWWKYILQIVPERPSGSCSPQMRFLAFFYKENLVREVRVEERILWTSLGSQVITREVSLSDSEAIYQLISKGQYSRIESPRHLRMLQFLRGWGQEQNKTMKLSPEKSSY